MPQEERAEQLRGFSFLSGIVAGFIVSSFLQVTFDPLGTVRWLQVVFAVTVGVTVRLSDRDLSRSVQRACPLRAPVHLVQQAACMQGLHLQQQQGHTPPRRRSWVVCKS